MLLITMVDGEVVGSIATESRTRWESRLPVRSCHAVAPLSVVISTRFCAPPPE